MALRDHGLYIGKICVVHGSDKNNALPNYDRIVRIQKDTSELALVMDLERGDTFYWAQNDLREPSLRQAMHGSLLYHRRFHEGKHRERIEDQLLEEMAELSAKLMQARRGRISREELDEEIADVEICLTAMKSLSKRQNFNDLIILKLQKMLKGMQPKGRDHGDSKRTGT